MTEELLLNVLNVSVKYLKALPYMNVGTPETYEKIISSIDTILPEDGESAEVAIDKLIKSTEKGLINSRNSRYFGFVIGGSTPACTAADWLTSIWDQNAQVYNSSPIAAIIEEVISNWILDLLSLPKDAGVGFVTGAQMANFTGLVTARNVVLKQHGWDFDKDGLQGAPVINILCGEFCHGTVLSAIRMMGLGQKNIRIIKSDDQGRIISEDLHEVCDNCNGPIIICAQAGNVNTGAFDPFSEISDIAKKYKAWLHIDGAFGLWARVSPKLEPLVIDIDKADSWTVDAHKWLNVPYDSGIVIIRDKSAHRNLKTTRCSYAGPIDETHRDGSQWVPENSRRARGFVLYAAMRNLGRNGVKSIIENSCDIALLFKELLGQLPHARILNDVVLNQVLCRMVPDSVSDLDKFNKSIVERIQRDGVCWLGTTIWNGKTVLRISISNWCTSKEDVYQSVKSIHNSIEDELKISCQSRNCIK